MLQEKMRYTDELARHVKLAGYESNKQEIHSNFFHMTSNKMTVYKISCTLYNKLDLSPIQPISSVSKTCHPGSHMKEVRV